MQRILTNHGQQIQLAQFSGVLKVKNHKYELAAVEREPSQQLIGQMKSKELLIQNLEELGFQDIEIGKDELIIPGTGCHGNCGGIIRRKFESPTHESCDMICSIC